MEPLRDAAEEVRNSINQALEPYEPWQIAAGSIVVFSAVKLAYELVFVEENVLGRTKRWVLTTFRRLPPVRAIVDEKLAEANASMEKSMLEHTGKDVAVTYELPKKSVTDAEVLDMLAKFSDCGSPDQRRLDGKVSGTIYVGGPNFESYNKLLCQAYEMFAWTNPLHPNVFPGVRQMESEVVRMTLTAYHGPESSCGSVTSGGTESILMAIKSYREKAAADRGVTRPNIVLPTTAHPAFDKAAQYFKIFVRKVPVDPVTKRASVEGARRAIDRNTICIVGSCPQYPHGCVDPIAELAAVAQQAGVGMHVDCCLGSFLVPFMRLAGFDFPDFDFSVPGVTSISADTHKFGYAPKGSSVVMYRSPEYMQHQYSVFPDWPGGIYGTPTMAGSRPGALIAATWTAMMANGVEGYVNSTKDIVDRTRYIAEGVKRIPGLKLMAAAEVSVVAWTSDVFDINRLNGPLTEGKGWDLNFLQFPAGAHLCVTRAHSQDACDKFLADLAECTAACMKNPTKQAEGAGAMYGASQAVVDRSIIEDVVRRFCNNLYVLPKKPKKN